MKTSRYVDCSTCHITRDDNDLLEVLGDAMRAGRVRGNSLVVYVYEYGYFVLIPGDDNAISGHGFSRAFVSLVRKARKAGADMLRIDRDGTDHDGLAKFDW